MSELTCLIHMSQKCLGCRKSLESRLEVAVGALRKLTDASEAFELTGYAKDRRSLRAQILASKYLLSEALAKMEGSK